MVYPEKNILVRGNSKYKTPELDARLECLNDCKEASRDGAERGRRGK